MASTETRGISSPATAKELVTLMSRAWWPFRVAARSLDAVTLDRPTAAGWTYKQMLAHIAAWHELAARRIHAFADHGVTDPAAGPDAAQRLDGLGLADADRKRLLRTWDMDGFNAAVSRAASARTGAEVLDALDLGFRRLRDEVSRLTDQQAQANVSDGRSFAHAIVEGDSFGHYAEHEGELRAGLPVNGSALAARVDEDWKHFRELVRHLGRAGLSERTPSGWTYKDLLAHVVGWLDDVPRRIEAMRAGTDRPIASQQEIDEYNARSVSSHALVGPEAMLDELDTAYRRARSVIAAMSDVEVRTPQLLGLVTTRTFLHWEEHLAEFGGHA